MVPNSRGVGRISLHTEDDSRGKYFQGDTAGMGDLPGVREGTGEGVTGGAPPNPARHG